jgi:hypothetical protein
MHVRPWTALILGSAVLLVAAAAACKPDVPSGEKPVAGAVSDAPAPADNGHQHAPPPPPGPAPAPSSSGPDAGHDLGHTAGLAYDPKKIPPGVPGIGKDWIENTGELPTPSNDEVSSFRTVCQYSHMSSDDPIVYPGQPGAAHLHMFWGNSLTDANSTAESIATKGNGTCRGGTVNRTAYWAPAVIDTHTGTPIAPDLIHVYYKSGYLGVKPQQIQPMPAGLRMIAGNAKATAPQDYVGWKCWDVGGASKAPIPKCGVGDSIAMTVEFPQCWNGKDLDSPDHKSHMSYAIEGKGCPAAYPVALPVITFNILYKVTPGLDTSGWRLSSDMYPANQPAGYSAHGDWFNGWKQDIEQTWIHNCVSVKKPVSCGSHMLGDGRVMGFDV